MKLITGLLAIAVVALGAYVLGMRSSEGPSRILPRTAATITATPHAAPVHAPMDTTTFWRLVADTRAAAGHDTGRQSQLLEHRLSDLPAQQIVGFQRIRHRLDQRAYTWDLWGAAYVIEDGCSDDCFRDFRAYLISLGRGPYEAALRDPAHGCHSISSRRCGAACAGSAVGLGSRPRGGRGGGPGGRFRARRPVSRSGMKTGALSPRGTAEGPTPLRPRS